MLACPSVDFFLYKHCKVQKLAVKTHYKEGEKYMCVCINIDTFPYKYFGNMRLEGMASVLWGAGMSET